ncbi:MAG: hypothetical protein JXA22_07205 [Candidatus Thermoplasmatota archaeon]|nr:hypothetical protein [Candidatus Thermoplasmatota archaeon]
MVREQIIKAFIRWYPETFVALAHLGGALLCIWMRRWDLLTAGIAFGIPSSLLFWDLLPSGKGFIIRFIKWYLRP